MGKHYSLSGPDDLCTAIQFVSWLTIVCSTYVGGGRGYISVLIRDIELLQQQRAADSASMSEKVPGNRQVQIGSI